MEDAIATATQHGLEKFLDYGLLGIIACLGMGFILFSAYRCSRDTKQGLDNNTDAIKALSTIMAEIKGMLNK